MSDGSETRTAFMRRIESQLKEWSTRLDHMMAETLVKMYEQGKLNKYMEADYKPKEPPQQLSGSITIENISHEGKSQ